MVLKRVGHFFGWILLGCNGLISALMLLCAYSSYIDPRVIPVLSCAGLAFPIFLLLNTAFLVFWLVVYKKYALLPFLTLLASLGALRSYVPVNAPEFDIPKDAIKILSYNVMAYMFDKPHEKGNPNEVLEYLAQSGADIICTQEALLSKNKNGKLLNEDVVRKVMSDYPYYSHFQKGVNCLDCFSRYPILATHRLTYESAGNGSVAYEIKVGRDTLLVINNHLESNKLTLDDRAIYKDLIKDPEHTIQTEASRQLIAKIVDASVIRSSQADSVAKYIRESQHKNIIVCGDFNDSPLSYSHRVIRENLTDAFIESGSGLGISYHKNGFYFRIDHILVSNNWQPYNCTIDRSIDASDHYPIWCYIRKR